jgi:hypothetical protein
MARALRIERVGGRYHVTARGNERKAIFRDDTDRFHLLELLGELGERFGARVHAYVLIMSSYPGYAGYSQPLPWVWRELLARLCGGNSPEQRCAALRAYTESAVRQGRLEPPWARLVDGIVLGSATFARSLRQESRGNAREQKCLRTPGGATWAQIVSALEASKAESWADFANRHGDWGRDAALWLGRRAGRLRLAQLGKLNLAGGLDYAVVSKAIASFARRLAADTALAKQLVHLPPPNSGGQRARSSGVLKFS